MSSPHNSGRKHGLPAENMSSPQHSGRKSRKKKVLTLAKPLSQLPTGRHYTYGAPVVAAAPQPPKPSIQPSVECNDEGPPIKIDPDHAPGSTKEERLAWVHAQYEELVKWIDEDASVILSGYSANGLPDSSILAQPLQECTLEQLKTYYEGADERLKLARAEVRDRDGLLAELKQVFIRHWRRDARLEAAIQDKKLARAKLHEAERYLGGCVNPSNW